MNNIAVIYARYSSSHQREESIDGQLRECSVFAQRNNLTVVRNYIDRAISGRTDKRPEFQRMIEDSASRSFNFVIVYTLDRFARNRAASAMYKMKLRQNGVKVLSAKENIADDPSGIILESVLEGIAEYYSAELAQKITRGMTENALAGKWTSGIVPFGFLRDENRRLVPDPKTAPFVTRIFEMYVNGSRIVDISAFLKMHGIKTRAGFDFSRSSFKSIFSNEIYIGKFKWKDIVIENYVAPLVSKEVFMRCQERSQANKKSVKKDMVKVRPSDNYLLSGKLYCGHCGGMMHGISGTSRSGDAHYYYACSNKRLKKANCHLPNMQRDLLESAICFVAYQILADAKNIDIIASQALACNKKRESDLLLSLKAQRKEIKAKLDNCIKAIEQGIVSAALAQTVANHERTLNEIEAAISLEDRACTPPELSKQRIVYFLSKIFEADNAKEKVLNTLVRRADIEKDGDKFIVTVRFNYSATSTLDNQTEFALSNVRRNSAVVDFNAQPANILKAVIFKAKYFQVSFPLPSKAKYLQVFRA